MTGRGWRGWTAVALVAAATLTAGCEIKADGNGLSVSGWSGQASDTWTRTYAVEPGGRIEILNVNGEVRAEAWTGSQVEVTAERTASAASDESARELLGKVEMREEVSPSRVRVETHGPKSWRGGYGAKFLVRVPAGVHVDLRTVNGGVRLANVGGEVRATSTNGGVKGTISGASLVEARTTNGGVELSIAGAIAPDADVRLSSVNGGVRLDVPADTKASVSARCTNGRVDVSALPLAVEGEPTRRRVQGTLNGGGARIDLQTTNGGVTVGRS